MHGSRRGSSASPELPMGRKPMTDRIPARIIETVDPSQPIRLTPAQSGGPIHTRSFSGRFRNLRLLGGALLMLLYFGTVWLDWDGRQAVLGPGPAAVPYLRCHLLAAGFHPALGDSDHRRVRPVLHHRPGGAHLVRLRLPAEHLDLDVHVGGKDHRRRPPAAHQARCCALVRRQAAAPCRQAHAVAGHQPGHGAGLRRLFHPGTRTGGRPCPLRGRCHHRLLAAVLHRRDLHQCRLAARAGVPAHAPIRASRA